MRQAFLLGSRRMLYLGLYLASDLMGAVLPREISKMAQTDPMVKVLAGQVNEWLLKNTDTRPNGLKRYLFQLKMKERLQDKAQFCLRRAIVPDVLDWEFLPLPVPLFPLYYPIRFIRLAKKYMFKPIKSIYNRKST